MSNTPTAALMASDLPPLSDEAAAQILEFPDARAQAGACIARPGPHYVRMQRRGRVKRVMMREKPRLKPQSSLYASKRGVLDELKALPAESTAPIDMVGMPVSAHRKLHRL